VKSNLLREVRFTPCFDFVSALYDKHFDKVLGRMWRFAQMGDGVCKASVGTIARETGLSVSTVKRIIPILEADRLIKDKTPNVKYSPHVYSINEKEIVAKNRKWIMDGSPYSDGKKSEAEVVQGDTLGSSRWTTRMKNRWFRMNQGVVQGELGGGSRWTTYYGKRWFRVTLKDTDSIKERIKRGKKVLKDSEKNIFFENPLPTADSKPTAMPNATALPAKTQQKKLSRTNTLRLGKRHGELLRGSEEYCSLEASLPSLTGAEKQNASERMRLLSRSLKAQAMKDIGL